jgi:hypothetical protein
VCGAGKLCIEVNPGSKTAFLSEELCIGCGICVRVRAAAGGVSCGHAVACGAPACAEAGLSALGLSRSDARRRAARSRNARSRPS